MVMFRFEKRDPFHIAPRPAAGDAAGAAATGLPLVWSQGFIPSEFSFAMARLGRSPWRQASGLYRGEAAAAGASLPPGLRILDAGELPEDASRWRR